MSWLKGWLKQLRVLVRKSAVERELDEELAFHIEMETEKNVHAGMSREEARRAALLEFGGVERYKEQVRDARWVRLLEDLAADARYAWRTLRKKPGFAAAAIATLGLGIGGTTAVFGVVDALFLRYPAGVREAEEVVRLYFVRDTGMIQTPSGAAGSYVDYEAIRSAAPAFSSVAAFLYPREVDLDRGERAQRIRGVAVTQSYFPLLGVRPAAGRLFRPEEDSAIGTHPVAVISHGFWQRHFGGAAGAIGSDLLLNGQKLSVVGVTQKDFTGIDPDPVDVWVPMAMAAPLGLAGGGSEDWRTWPMMATVYVIGRLAPGVSRDAAVAQAGAALRHAAEAAPELDPTPEVLVGTLVPAGGPHRSPAADLALWLLLVTAIVLVIACANVANLLLARATVRRRETAVRLSLGAGRSRLIRQYLAESLLLAVLGGAAGLLLALWGARLARQFPLPPSAGEMDGRLLVFAFALALATGAVFGLAPALQAGRTDPVDGLKDGRAGAHPKRGRARRALIGLQVALSVILLVGAGLFVRSLRAVYAVDPGLETRGLWMLSVDLAKAGYAVPDREAFYEAARERVLRTPGVVGAAMTHFPPFSSSAYGSDFHVPGHESLRIERENLNWVGPGYFETVGTAVLRGRGISEHDGAGSEPVAVVNEALAHLLAPAGEVVGLCVVVHDKERTGECTRIVGVAENQRNRYLESEVTPTIYLARDREPDALSWGGPYLLVRAREDDPELAGPVRVALQGLKPGLPYVALESVTERIRPQILPYRLGATLFTLFGVLALLLAAVGLYGMLNFFVAERTSEIGIRRSLGAPARAVVALVVRQGMGPVAIGLALGILVALAGMRVLASLLFGVDARDPLVFGGVAVFLAAVALAATLVPAGRAARVDPVIALRSE